MGKHLQGCGAMLCYVMRLLLFVFSSYIFAKLPNFHEQMGAIYMTWEIFIYPWKQQRLKW